MREIKFRGMRLSNGTWTYGYLVANTFSNMIQYLDSNGRVELDSISDNTVGQFIGLKDKNGVEAYEGDIVKMPKGIVGSIEYCRAGYKVIDWTNYMNELSEDFEIIGNIHETPELVETIEKREDLEQEIGVRLGPGESE